MMTSKTFNKWFSVFILAGMSLALVAITAIKFGAAQTGRWMLLISAFGSLMGVLSTLCSANGLIVTFLFGLLDVSIYGVVCLLTWKAGGSGLGNAILHFIYFVPMQFIGFAQWRKRGAGHAESVNPRKLNGRQWAICTIVMLLGSLAAYFLIGRFDRSAAEGFIKWAVVLDVLPLMCNIFGQLLMSMAYREQWIFWMGVNIFSIMMWSRTLASTGDSYALIYIIKYVFYMLNSINGMRLWWADSRQSAS